MTKQEACSAALLNVNVRHYLNLPASNIFHTTWERLEKDPPIQWICEHATVIGGEGECQRYANRLRQKAEFGKLVRVAVLDVDTPFSTSNILIVRHGTGPRQEAFARRQAFKEQLGKHRSLVERARKNNLGIFVSKVTPAETEALAGLGMAPDGFWRVVHGKVLKLKPTPFVPVQLGLFAGMGM